MTLEEINAIEDYELRRIRLKYWKLRHDAFMDEQGVPDSRLGQTWDELSAREEQEIADYLSGITKAQLYCSK